MFWTLLLPLGISTVLAGCLATAAIIMARRSGWRQHLVSALVIVAATLAIVPMAAVIMPVVDAYRFGRFHYGSSAEINDWRVERYFPTTATDITIDKDRGGFRANYHIAKKDLIAFVDAEWDQSKGTSVYTREQAGQISHSWDELRNLGMTSSSNFIKFVGPIKSNHAGFVLWYDESHERAFHSAGYW